jgi:hypothetical protein
VDLANKLFLYSYDKKTYKYTLVDLIELVHEVTELDKYVFVVRGRVGQSTTPMEAILSDNYPTDKNTEETTFHIDIKSEGLRDILRIILGDVQGISLKEPRLSGGLHYT